MPIDVAALGRCWERACDDAGLTSPAEARLYYLPGGADLFQAALHLHPGTFAAHEDRFPFTRGQLQDANQIEHPGLHRIAVRDTPDEPTAVALLRHELEHARQHRASLPVYNFMAVAEDALSSAFATPIPRRWREARCSTTSSHTKGTPTAPPQAAFDGSSATQRRSKRQDPTGSCFARPETLTLQPSRCASSRYAPSSPLKWWPPAED
jgi:hypothetical protein